MKNIALSLRFDGSLYHGWQSQKNAAAIQDILSRAILRLTGKPPYPELAGCGRTDAGVHANEFIANFGTNSTIPAERYPQALLPHLPPDISVRDAAQVSPEFHSRFSCKKKEYVYKIYHSNLPDPFLYNRAYFHPYALNAEKMRAAARHIVGTHDFSAFMAAGSVVRSHTRTVFYCEVEECRTHCEIIVCADGFLYNMVRIIAGTLLYVSDGKLLAEDIPQIIESRDRTMSGMTLPAHGLYMNKVWYGDEPGLTGIRKMTI